MQFHRFGCFLAGLALAGHAAAMTCDEQLGKAKAAELVRQCKNVSPATRPPCNASNSCDLIAGEIKRGCKILGDDAPPYCPAIPAELVKGKLVGGGGIDNYFLRIRLDDGKVIHAYCTTRCGDWFTDPDKNDVVKLKPGLRGKQVSARIVTERNGGRIAGPGEDDSLEFIKSAKIGGD